MPRAGMPANGWADAAKQARPGARSQQKMAEQLDEFLSGPASTAQGGHDLNPPGAVDDTN